MDEPGQRPGVPDLAHRTHALVPSPDRIGAGETTSWRRSSRQTHLAWIAIQSLPGNRQQPKPHHAPTRATASLAPAPCAALVVLIAPQFCTTAQQRADPNQDDRFRRCSRKTEIPAAANKALRHRRGPQSVSQTRWRHAGGRRCGRLRNDAYNIDPVMRFFTLSASRRPCSDLLVAVGDYHSKPSRARWRSAMANFEPGSNELTHRVVASTRSAVNWEATRGASVSDMTIILPGWRETDGCDAARCSSGSRGGPPNLPPIPVLRCRRRRP